MMYQTFILNLLIQFSVSSNTHQWKHPTIYVNSNVVKESSPDSKTKIAHWQDQNHDWSQICDENFNFDKRRKFHYTNNRKCKNYNDEATGSMRMGDIEKVYLAVQSLYGKNTNRCMYSWELKALKLEDVTLNEINQFLIKPMTNVYSEAEKKTNPTFAEYLYGPDKKKADFYVSHCWSNSFKHLYLQLKDHAKKHAASVKNLEWKDVRYWICAFANSQHDGTDFTKVFEKTMSGINNVQMKVVAIQPTTANPIKILSRPWCVYEMILAQERGFSYEFLGEQKAISSMYKDFTSEDIQWYPDPKSQSAVVTSFDLRIFNKRRSKIDTSIFAKLLKFDLLKLYISFMLNSNFSRLGIQ